MISHSDSTRLQSVLKISRGAANMRSYVATESRAKNALFFLFFNTNAIFLSTVKTNSSFGTCLFSDGLARIIKTTRKYILPLLKLKSRVPALFLLVGASQYEPMALFFASFSIELHEVGTSIKKPTSLILCDYLKILLISRKTLSDKRRDGSYPRKYVGTPRSGVVCN